MSASLHTKERWAVEVSGSTIRITDAEGNDLFRVGDCHDPVKYANARHAVVCVNACAGVSDIFLTEYKGGIAAALATSKERLEQRDALAAVLRDLLTATEQFESDAITTGDEYDDASKRLTEAETAARVVLAKMAA